jgi:hypothetical protein
MRFFFALILFIAACVGLFQLATGGKGLESIAPPATVRLDTDRVSLEATAQAAAYQAALLSDALTQTAMARAQQLAVETQTAQDLIARRTADSQASTAAVVLQQTREVQQITVEAGQAQATATAQAAATIAQGTAAAISIQATGDAIGIQAFATQQYQQVQINGLRVAQEQIKTDVYSTLRYWPVFASIALALIAMFFGVWLMKLRSETNHVLIPRSLDGSAAGVIMRNMAINIDRSIGPILNPAAGMLPVTAQQMEVTTREQSVQGIRGLTRAGYPASSRQAAEGLATRRSVDAPPAEQACDLPAVAPWTSLDNWHGGPFALGIGTNNAGITLNPERSPNLLVAGTSGIGKTMMSLRPIMAEALVSGWQVLLMNEKGGDFTPLKSHSNLVVVEGKANEIAAALESVSREVDRRDQLLKSAGVSTYARHPEAAQVIGPRVMIVIDELVSLIYGAPTPKLSDHIWRMAIDITSKCRAMGLMMVFSTTDPTYRLGNSWLAVRANCARMVFRLLDPSASRAVLDMGGAEQLTGCQFIARLEGDPVRGVAFWPSDEDVSTFITRRQVPVLPAPAFLALGAGEQVRGNSDATRDQRIRDLAATGKSLNEIQREVFGFSGGQAYNAVKAVLGSNTSIDTTELADSAPTGA